MLYKTVFAARHGEGPKQPSGYRENAGRQVLMPVLSVIIPAYNEGSILRHSLDRLSEVLETLDERYELIVVDDGSQDDTWRILAQASDTNPAIRGIRFSRNFGKDAAIVAGLCEAKGDAAIVIDADLQHPPNLIPEMVEKWRGGARIVSAIKRSPGKVKLKWARKNFYRLFNRLSGKDLKGSSDFVLLDRQVIEEFLGLPERNIFFRGLVAWLGNERETVEFEVEDRAAGESKFNPFKLISVASDAITSFSGVPLQFVTGIGAIFLIFAFVLGIQTLYVKLSGGAAEGFTTVILVVLFTGAVLMIALGIIGQYLAKIYDEVKRRPRYVIADRTGDLSASAEDRDRTDQSGRHIHSLP